jgi:hypothetical protein
MGSVVPSEPEPDAGRSLTGNSTQGWGGVLIAVAPS